MAGPYADIEQLKAYLVIPEGDEADDELLELALGAASSAIEARAGQVFGEDDAEVPQAIVLATLIQASRLFKRKDAPFGIAGSPEMGSELRLLAKLDPDVEMLLVGHRRVWGAV